FAGMLVFKELGRKDYGQLTLQRDERYRNVMANCTDPQQLLLEAKLFEDHGLKSQANLLRRRAQWRARPEEQKKAHEDAFQRAMTSENIPAILEVAAHFEGWTATVKAQQLRARAQALHEAQAVKAAEEAAEATKVPAPAPKPGPKPKRMPVPAPASNGHAPAPPEPLAVEDHQAEQVSE
ncbi:MAG: hypothetical protein FWD17_19305, partial [Polyangiaceae bacterium]|nr:hypothetical protein [Polyangiaceae bacterium]